MNETLYELRLPATGMFAAAGFDKLDQETGTLPLLKGFPEILAWFKRRYSAPLTVTGPDDYPGCPAGSFRIASGDELPAYACPYSGPTKPHPTDGWAGKVAKGRS